MKMKVREQTEPEGPARVRFCINCKKLIQAVDYGNPIGMGYHHLYRNPTGSAWCVRLAGKRAKPSPQDLLEDAIALGLTSP